MDFLEIAKTRQSCRKYDTNRKVEEDKLNSILEAARLSPSACNSQPYFITVCKGEVKNKVAKATQGMGMNKFAAKAPVMIVVSEDAYNKTAAMGARVKNNDYRSIDIGIVTAYLTAEATAQGLSTCILGWLDDEKIRKICGNGTHLGALGAVAVSAAAKEGNKSALAIVLYRRKHILQAVRGVSIVDEDRVVLTGGGNYLHSTLDAFGCLQGFCAFLQGNSQLQSNTQNCQGVVYRKLSRDWQTHLHLLIAMYSGKSHTLGMEPDVLCVKTCLRFFRNRQHPYFMSLLFQFFH